MKKLIVFLVVFALFAGSVFAQEEQEEKYGWKFGFGIRAKVDFLYYTGASGSLVEDDDTYTFGEHIAGSFLVMANKYAWAPGNEIWLSFSHTGENHDIYVEVVPDGSMYKSMTLMQLFGADFMNGGDWWARGNAGIFDGYVGNQDYGGFVPVYDSFNYYIGTGDDYLKWDVNRFGVYRPNFDWKPSAVIGAFGRPYKPQTFALGISPIDGYRFALGTAMNMMEMFDKAQKPFGSISGINGTFMFSGKDIADMVSFDVFYGIQGIDDDTRFRPDILGADNDKNDNVANWENIFGLYAGVNLLNGKLGVSLGYTANFRVYEKWAYYPNPEPDSEDNDPKKSEPGSYSDPIYSGISLHANFTGVDNLNVTLNNNISFAGAKGDLASGNNKVIKLGLGSTPDYLIPIYQGDSQSWFVLHTSLSAKYQFSAPLTLTLQLANVLGIDKKKKPDDSIRTITTDEFRIALTAEYSLGSVTFGTGLSFGVLGRTDKQEAVNTITKKANIFQCGIPLVFQVAF